MAITKMNLVNIKTNSRDYDDVLIRCANSKLFHPELAANAVKDVENAQLLAEENYYSDYVNTLKNISNSIGLDMKAKGKSDREYSVEDIVSFIREVENQFKQISDSVESYVLTDDDKVALDTLKEFDFKEFHDTQYVSFGMGRLPIENLKKLKLLEDKKFVITKLHTNSHYHWILYATTNTYLKETRKIMAGMFLEEIMIPHVDSNKIIAKYEDQLLDIYTYCVNRSQLFELHQYVAIIDGWYNIFGFVPSKKVDEFKSEFEGLYTTVTVSDPNDKPQLTPPTLLKNNWFFRPFELFVDMYSLPAYSDFDPTVFVAITYCLLFGIMFGDVGQGLLLLIGGLLLEAKTKNKLAGVIGRVGITSMIFGFLFGSVFGYEEILTPIHEGLFGIRGKLFHVMANSSTMVLLIGAVLIGAVLILTTMIINILLNIKHKRWGEVLFSQNGVAGFIFYAYILLGIGLPILYPEVNIMTKPLMAIFIGIPVLLFFFKEPLTHLIEGKGLVPKGGWGGFVLETFFEVFEIMLSFVTNSMSYLRVGGFVLSHAGMMLVVMTLVEMTGSAGPVVLIFGNLFVMALEGLIVGIQTLRLEYYEMFSRYFTGGGRKFTLMASKN